MDCPTTARVDAIAEHMESLGAYTQAREVLALGAERDRLANSLSEAQSRIERLERDHCEALRGITRYDDREDGMKEICDGETKMEEKPPYPFCSSPERCIAAHRCTRTVGGEPWCCAD